LKLEKANPPTNAQGTAWQNSRRLIAQDGTTAFLDGAAVSLSPLSALPAFDILMKRFLTHTSTEVKETEGNQMEPSERTSCPIEVKYFF